MSAGARGRPLTDEELATIAYAAGSMWYDGRMAQARGDALLARMQLRIARELAAIAGVDAEELPDVRQLLGAPADIEIPRGRWDPCPDCGSYHDASDVCLGRPRDRGS